MKRNAPYQNWTLNELKHALKVHISRLSVEGKLENLWIDTVDEAFLNESWNVLIDFNGCSIVQDTFHPSPACFVHDYAALCGQGGVVSDRVFYHLMLAEGMTKAKSTRRWFAVRVGWYAFYLWKYAFSRKLRKPSPAMIELDKYFKNNQNELD